MPRAAPPPAAVATAAASGFLATPEVEVGALVVNFRALNDFEPNINLLRDPRWGRALEVYGEVGERW